MKTQQRTLPALLAGGLAALLLASLPADAARPAGPTVTLIQFQDMHGHLHPHAEIFPDGRMDPDSGGIAKITTLIKQVRADNPNSLLLAVGDTTHGSAETTFTLGDAIMPALNALGIDAFLPGNWDFGYGPRVYRQRFVAGDFSTVLAPNNRTTMAFYDGRPGHEASSAIRRAASTPRPTRPPTSPRPTSRPSRSISTTTTRSRAPSPAGPIPASSSSRSAT